jgi:hypothetical protein
MPLMTLLFMQAALAGWCAYKRAPGWNCAANGWASLLWFPWHRRAWWRPRPGFTCCVSNPRGSFTTWWTPAGRPFLIRMRSCSAWPADAAGRGDLGWVLRGAVRGGPHVGTLLRFSGGGPGAVGLLLFLGFWRRSFHVGAWDQLRTNEAVMLWDHVVGALGLAWLVTALFAVWLSGRVFRDDKTVAPRTSMPSLPPV